MTFRPTAIISMDGRNAVFINDCDGEYRQVRRQVAIFPFSARSTPSGEKNRLLVTFSRDARQGAKLSAFGIPSSGSDETDWLCFAQAAIGDWLDQGNQLLMEPHQDNMIEIECFYPSFREWELRKPASDDHILDYIKAGMYRGWEFDLDELVLGPADMLRLGVRLQTFERLTRLLDGEALGIQENTGYSIVVRPMQEFLRNYRLSIAGKSDSQEDLFASLSAPRYAAVQEHLRKARLYLQSETLDLANSVKETACAVEALARIVAHEPYATLGELIKRFRKEQVLDPALAKTLEGLWGFASNSPGVRHGGEPTITMTEVRLVEDMARGAIRYLLGLDR